MNGDLSRSLVDAAAEAMKPFDDADLNWITVRADGYDMAMSPATRRVVSARAAVAAVLETLADGIETVNWPMSISRLRGLAAEVKEERP